MPTAGAAGEFERLLAAGLAARATNAVFEQIGTYLRAISQPDLAGACLQRYLAVYRTYENDGNRSRSDAAFYLVFKRVLDLAKPAQLDTWYETLTSASLPRSPLRQRFGALGKADQDRLLQLARAPGEARKETASVLGELRDAFRAARKRPPATDGELLAFDPVEAAGPFRREYEFWLGNLRRSYDVAAQGRYALPGTDLAAQCAAFWAFVRAQRRDGLRLFQLLAYWRRDRVDQRGNAVPSSYAEQIAYAQIVAGLLSYALATKAYTANVRRQSFTSDEWNFVLGPLRRLQYADTYDTLLHRFPANAATFPQQCELFLRLLAFAAQKDISLATNAELSRVATASAASARAVIDRLTAGSIEGYRAPSFVVSPRQSGTLAGAGTYSVGTEIAETFRIVHFEGSPPQQLYVEFDGIPCVLFKMPISVFVRYARDAPFELVRKYTAPLIYLIPLLFQVLLAIPGVVDGGFIGLVRALLSPVELEAASAALDQFGLDPDQAGWWLLAASLLTHRVTRRAADALKTRGIQDPALEPRGTQPAAVPGPGLAASESALARGTAARATGDRLADPRLADLAEFAADAEDAQVVAGEIAELEGQLAQEEGEELAEAAGGSSGGRPRSFGGRAHGRRPGYGGRSRGLPGEDRGPAGSSRGIGGRGVGGRGTGGPLPRSAPRGTAGRVLIDTVKANGKKIDAATRTWLQDIAEEWREQCARFRKRTDLSASEQGVKAHQATQRAITSRYRGTVAEEITGVSSSNMSRRSDLRQDSGVAARSRIPGAQPAVVELKPWAARMPDGRLATSRVAVESGVETLQIQAYGIVDRELGRPVFVLTANGKVWTPEPGGGWIEITVRR